MLAEVHRSNMTKTLGSMVEAEHVADAMNSPGHSPFQVQQAGLPNRYIVVRTTDGKIIKPPEPWYSPADIKSVLYGKSQAQ